MRFRRALLAAASLIALAYVAASAYLWFAQRKLVFEPSDRLVATPSELNMRWEQAWISSPVNVQSSEDDSGGLLSAWWIPASRADALTVLYLHGNDKNISAELPRARELHEMGFSQLLIDYRGFGNSSGGWPSEAHVYQDAESAWTFLVEQRRVDPANIVIFGHSLGGAVAIELATRHRDARALIVESTFTRLEDVAATQGYQVFPIRFLLTERFDSLSRAAKLRLPVLLLHGTLDALVPLWMTERLAAEMGSRARVGLMLGAGHEDGFAVDRARYRRLIGEFIEGTDSRAASR